jgi:hypothetical protein
MTAVFFRAIENGDDSTPIEHARTTRCQSRSIRTPRGSSSIPKMIVLAARESVSSNVRARLCGICNSRLVPESFRKSSPHQSTLTIALGDFLAALMKGSRIGEIVRESLTIRGWVSIWCLPGLFTTSADGPSSRRPSKIAACTSASRSSPTEADAWTACLRGRRY